MDPVTATMGTAQVVGAAAKVGEIAYGAMVITIKSLYGIAKNVEEFLDDHIEKMKASEDVTIARTGRVMEQAKLGFGVGFISSVIIIAVGQLLLGNPLSAVSGVVMSPFNPLVMTCAAVGAIYYGWRALSDQEREEILEKISKGVNVGVELVRSVISFVVVKIKTILSQENIEEIKKYVSTVASAFGKTISDITKKTIDKVRDTFASIRDTTSDVAEKTADTASDIYEKIKNTAEKTASSTMETAKKLKTRVISDVNSKSAVTCGKSVPFNYVGSVSDGVKILLPNSTFSVSRDFFQAIIDHFKGKEVVGGFSMTNPTPGGFGVWVKENSSSINSQSLTPRHASFIAGILKEEGILTCKKTGNTLKLAFV